VAERNRPLSLTRCAVSIMVAAVSPVDALEHLVTAALEPHVDPVQSLALQHGEVGDGFGADGAGVP